MSKREKWEELVRAKLKNFEADTQPDDWKAILSRLPQHKRMLLLHKWQYAAAVIIGLFVLSGGYFLISTPENKPVVVDVQDTVTYSVQEEMLVAATNEESTYLAKTEEGVTNENKTESAETLVLNRQHNKANPIKRAEKEFVTEKLNAEKVGLGIESPFALVAAEPLSKSSYGHTLIADVTPVRSERTTKKRWGIGMGGGSYSVGTDGGGIPGLTYPTSLHVLNGESLNASANVQNKQNVSHKRPLSFGVGVGYALNDRWSLQSGLYYSMLKSEWWYVSDYQGVSKQKLHFLGIPIGVSYKIAEWNKVRLYASAGGMGEWNFDGYIKTKFYTDTKREQLHAHKSESIRMKEWQWSVNAKVGVSYPLFKFVNAFAEGGVNYYFDNGSVVETIRSDKPFHATLQAGIRLGF